MNRKAVTAALALALLGTMAFVSADMAPKPEKGMVIGTAVELSTYAMKGLGEENVDAMVSRTEQGFPVGIVEEETGEVWVCVYRSAAPASPMELGNEYMLPLMGKKVVAQGFKYKAKGVNVLRMNIISEY